MKKNGSPDPIFRTDEDRTYFLTTLHSHIKSLTKIHDEAHDELTLNETEISILKICLESPKSTQEILNILGLSSRSGNVKRSLSNLLKLNYLEFNLPNKPKSKNQKYRITNIGKKYLMK